MNEKQVSKNVYKNLVLATFVMIFFILINTAYYELPESKLLVMLKVISMVFLGVGIILLEIAFRKDSGKVAINAIEVLFLAGHALSTAHVVALQKINFANYILVSSYIFSIYYLFKAIITYTKEKREYLNSLSDIKEIVANDPVKKETTKKS